MVRSVSSSPLLLDALNPGPLTGRGNNTWLLDGAEPALIDAGIGVAAHVEAIARALGGRDLARVLVTHGHADHSSGVPALRERWPRVTASKFPGRAERPDDGFAPLRDGDRVRAGDDALVVMHTPGHAPDHLCFWNPRTRDLFAGDMVQLDNTVMIPAGRGGRLADYLRSLERLAALPPARIFPGHGPVIDRPLDLIRAYIAHRRMREEQIKACLRLGLTTPDAIVAHIYPELDAAVLPAARLTVEAHLEKLRDDGWIST